MGKASSSKKVARAAGTGGGRTSGGRTPWSYYGVIALVVVLGLVGTVVSREHRNSQIAGAGTVPPTVGGTPWNEAFAVYECGKFVPNIKTTKDPVGITTNGDGVIRIHPYVKSAAGKNATLGKFASSVGMKLNAAELQVPGGHLYHDGDTCDGKAAHIYVKQFAYAGDPSGTILKQNPTNVLLEDQQMLTVAFVPAADKGSIPAPPAAVQNALKAAAASTTTSTTAPSTATTAPTTATTAPTTATTKPATTSTTAPATTATTTATTNPTATTVKP
ncbi:hypothetical protein K6U06_15150 [Acidiferrimicrobium sp. IK]|uniref:hypothetical protein n=1 Tax=Acidiferrimicrobium sp. IK TaxID=2871700 RepID=UPI0021CB7166|nr:hypothetical protein [Acidiferrimicrobium sp. IK]MCU4185704.1 hypothetical protein [Acidiferrimicrobium sp. IK]